MKYIFRKAPEPSRTLAGAVWIWDGILENWQEIITDIEKSAQPFTVNNSEPFAWHPARTYDGRADGLRRNQIFGLTYSAENGHEPSRKIHNQIAALVDECVGKYATFFETEFGTVENFSLLKYEGSTGDHYDAHFDGGATSNRWISAIIYLNDDYEGGELEFVHFGIKMKPKVGSVVVFPSNYPYSHIAHAVTNGTKYAIVTFIAGV
jgi:predicted 2-oxoglutarate/Fe(II)-dependent dioxygenase YbiX